jgi:hypothetical protein
MSISDLSALGSFLSGVAVIFSFIFLALQMRQANLNQRALMQQGRVARTGEIMLRLTEPHMIESIMRGGAGDVTMSPVEIETFVRAVVAMFLNWEDSFIQNKAGTIDATGMDSDLTAMRHFLSLPGYRAVWRTIGRRQFSTKFCEQIDVLLGEASGNQPRRDLSTAWKAHVAEELAH